MKLDWRRTRVTVTGGAGFLGRAVCRLLAARGGQPFVPRRRDFDLTREQDVERLFEVARPEVVIHLAAEVGGIGANRAHPGRFFYANLAMGLHLIEHARKRGIRKFVQVGTVCSYPKHTPVPFREEDLWNGFPEETNAPYGIAKRALIVMLDAYRREYGLRSAVVLPVNLYGPGDNFDLETSHVIPALIRKMSAAADARADEVVCWGTGEASREFLYVDDAAEGILAAAETMEDPVPINLGTGEEITIRRLAETIARLVGYRGRLRWDPSKPDGQPRRCLDVTRARRLLGWSARTPLEEGLERTIAWFRSQGAVREVRYD
ncbi:MAG: GDP-L-fucose synthase [Acidobacteria bacterium]|nr:MAG: GDP-L-fucose synthase [Acidobacteriota bacterium]